MKKFVVLLLALLLTVSAMAVPAGAAADPNLTESGNPIVKEKITLTGFGNQNVTHKDWDQLYCFTEYEAMSNIHIEWITAPTRDTRKRKTSCWPAASIRTFSTGPAFRWRT
ncbi:MAG TPA: hypothetical protein PKE04_19345 [Clostridia bacterium]|nr:hypothetical protein [Clostridia bacterium]